MHDCPIAAFHPPFCIPLRIFWTRLFFCFRHPPLLTPLILLLGLSLARADRNRRLARPRPHSRRLGGARPPHPPHPRRPSPYDHDNDDHHKQQQQQQQQQPPEQHEPSPCAPRPMDRQPAPTSNPAPHRTPAAFHPPRDRTPAHLQPPPQVPRPRPRAPHVRHADPAAPPRPHPGDDTATNATTTNATTIGRGRGRERGRRRSTGARGSTGRLHAGLLRRH